MNASLDNSCSWWLPLIYWYRMNTLAQHVQKSIKLYNTHLNSCDNLECCVRNRSQRRNRWQCGKYRLCIIEELIHWPSHACRGWPSSVKTDWRRHNRDAGWTLDEPDIYADIKGSVIYGPNLDSELEGSHGGALKGSGLRARIHVSLYRFPCVCYTALGVMGSVCTLQPD